MNESEERQRGYDLETAVLAANIRRDNAEAQCARLGDAMSGLEAALSDAYRKLEAAEERIDQLERQLSDGGLRFHTARLNYLPSRRGTGCKSCGIWVPEKLNLDEFAKLSHRFPCPLAYDCCQDCGMCHEPGDKASCIEGHGDDPVHGMNCPIAQASDPMSCTCDDEPVPFRGQIGTGF